MFEYDLMIRNGNIIDGTGRPMYRADVAVLNGKITCIGKNLGVSAKQEIDADGLCVTPGFVDVHTHYDGQAVWDAHLAPSSQLGATTVVMGNCGVGFAPCKEQNHDVLISLMEGVEDIPGTALAEGLPWNWRSFSDYLDALDAKPRDIDVAALFPHGPLRVYVMGDRAVNRESASEQDIADMQHLLQEGLAAGAVGFSTSRTLIHRTRDGDYVPTYQAAHTELERLGEMLDGKAGHVFQMISDFDDIDAEFSMLRRICSSGDLRGSFSLMHDHARPAFWKQMLARVDHAQASGVDIRAQVLSRPLGVLMGLTASLTPFSARPTFRNVAKLPFVKRLEKLREPAVKAAILAERDQNPHLFVQGLGESFSQMYPVEMPLDYMPAADKSVLARAKQANMTAAEWLYDWLLQDEGQHLIYIPAANFTDSIVDMLEHPHCVSALGDGGAHVGSICDASAAIYLLIHWVREKQKISLERAVQMLTQQPAKLYSLSDRGILLEGMKADINIFDFQKLQLLPPKTVADLPAGGRRFLQQAQGLIATLVSGQVIYRDGESTDALPGKLVRNSGYIR